MDGNSGYAASGGSTRRGAQRRAGGRPSRQPQGPPQPDNSWNGGGGAVNPQQQQQLYPDLSQEQQGSVAQQQGFPGQQMGGGGAGGGGAAFTVFDPSKAQQLMENPMANMAVQYGGQFAEQGKDYVQQNLEKYVAVSRLKYYFAVDTAYVGKKLSLLLFPYLHSDWAVSYSRDQEPVQPRHDVNAPDLYIPVMGFVTYVIVSAIALGLQNRFTPETLGVQASSALGYLALEIVSILLTLYIMSIGKALGYLDLAAFCGYKYVGMILVLMSGLMIGSLGYWVTLGWTCVSLAFFLVRSLKVHLLSDSAGGGGGQSEGGAKRRLYVLLMMAGVQPLFMWWLTLGLV